MAKDIIRLFGLVSRTFLFTKPKRRFKIRRLPALPPERGPECMMGNNSQSNFIVSKGTRERGPKIEVASEEFAIFGQYLGTIEDRPRVTTEMELIGSHRPTTCLQIDPCQFR